MNIHVKLGFSALLSNAVRCHREPQTQSRCSMPTPKASASVRNLIMHPTCSKQASFLAAMFEIKVDPTRPSFVVHCPG